MACPTGKLTIKSSDPRINYNLLPGEELLTCPYEPSHAILPIKFHRHVNNCHRLHCKAQQKKGKPVLFSICQHDRSHHVPNELLAYHEATCNARLDAGNDDWGCNEGAQEAGAAGGSSGGGCVGAEGFTVELREPPQLSKEALKAIQTEDWDAEPEYNIKFDADKRIHELRSNGYAYINTHSVVGLTKSEKKEFYAKEERRLKRYEKQALFNRLTDTDSCTTASTPSMSITTTTTETGAGSLNGEEESFRRSIAE